MKKFLYIAVIGMVISSCGGGGDDPPPAPENKAPSTPVQIYPANNDLCIDNAVNFQWNASTDPNGDVISYIVEVAKTSSFAEIIATKTATTTSTSISLEKGIAFYWRITAKDSKGLSSPVSAANGFYTEGVGVSNYVPFSPVLVAPELNATLQSPTATSLKWTASDVDGDTLTYDVFFGKTNPPANISSNQSANSFATATLDASSTYYWKIVVKDGKGGQTIGQVWNFKTD